LWFVTRGLDGEPRVSFFGRGEAARRGSAAAQIAAQVFTLMILEVAMLATTTDEAMIQSAVQRIERIEHELSGVAGEYIARSLRDRLRRGLTDRQKVIDEALGGDLLSHDVLMAEFDEMIDQGVMPPASLRVYAQQREKHPKRGRGRVWHDGWRRTYGFTLLIVDICLKFDLNPTRNAASEGPCGASVLSTALRRKGFKGVSESRLKNLWGLPGDATIFAIALRREWPEIMPYVYASGDPANFDWTAIRQSLRRKIPP
jgi:hypothetical protein